MDLLPKDLLIEIISLLEIEDIIKFSQSSHYFNNLCHATVIKNMLYKRLASETLIFDDFSLKELEFFSKLHPFNKQTNLSYNSQINIIDNISELPLDLDVNSIIKFKSEYLFNNSNN